MYKTRLVKIGYRKKKVDDWTDVCSWNRFYRHKKKLLDYYKNQYIPRYIWNLKKLLLWFM